MFEDIRRMFEDIRHLFENIRRMFKNIDGMFDHIPFLRGTTLFSSEVLPVSTANNIVRTILRFRYCRGSPAKGYSLL